MFRKITNRSLLIIFTVLAALVVFIFIYDRQKGDRTFKSELFIVDSAAVTSITIYPKGNGTDVLKLIKSGGKGWEISHMNKRYPADSGIMQRILQVLAHVLPERVAGTDRSNWKDYEITDSLGTRVVVEQGQKVAADFRVGKISFSQDRSPQNYGGRQNMSAKSHIRVAGDERVYVVDGFLSMMFADNPSQYRSRVIFRLDKSLVTKLTFIYPGDSSFVLSRSGSKWSVNNAPADSAETEKYLNSVATTMGNEFAGENDLIPVFNYTLKVEGNNMSPVEVHGAINPGMKKYYVKSDYNSSATFGSSAPNLFNQIFPSGKRFTP